MDYGILVPIVAYFVAMQLTNKLDLKPISGAVIATAIPFLFGAVIRWIASGAQLNALWGDAFNVKVLAYFVIQLVAMSIVFRFMKDTDSPLVYAVLGMVGFVIVVVAMVV
jgi:hypothetical protein